MTDRYKAYPDRAGSRREVRYLSGAALVFAGGVCWSLAGVTIRHLEAAGGWQILCYRSLGFLAVVLTYIAIRRRGRLVAAFGGVGWTGILAGLCLCSAFGSSIFSLINTSVANSVFLQSTQIFWAALIGWLVLGEAVRRAGWLAILLAFAGVGLMMGDGLDDGSLVGNLFGLLIGISVASYAVSLRKGGAIDMMPATCLGGVFGALAGAGFADGLAISTHDLLLCLFMGVCQIGLGFIFFTLGARNLPALDLMLLDAAGAVGGAVGAGLGLGRDRRGAGAAHAGGRWDGAGRCGGTGGHRLARAPERFQFDWNRVRPRPRPAGSPAPPRRRGP